MLLKGTTPLDDHRKTSPVGFRPTGILDMGDRFFRSGNWNYNDLWYFSYKFSNMRPNSFLRLSSISIWGSILHGGFSFRDIFCFCVVFCNARFFCMVFIAPVAETCTHSQCYASDGLWYYFRTSCWTIWVWVDWVMFTFLGLAHMVAGNPWVFSSAIKTPVVLSAKEHVSIGWLFLPRTEHWLACIAPCESILFGPVPPSN